jgi:flagellar basal body-associated protein FliL
LRSAEENWGSSSGLPADGLLKLKKSKRATHRHWSAALVLLATGGLVALLVLAKSVGGWGLEAFPPNPFSRVMGDEGDYRRRAAKPIVSLPDVVVALNGPTDLYVDAAFDLEVASEQDRDAVTRQMPRVRNETIEFLSQLTPNELRGSAELSRTKARLLDRFRGAMPRQRLEALYLSYLAVAAK